MKKSKWLLIWLRLHLSEKSYQDNQPYHPHLHSAVAYSSGGITEREQVPAWTNPSLPGGQNTV